MPPKHQYRPRGDAHRVRYKKYMQEKGRLTRAWMDELKSQPCMDCGRSFPPYCMDFDHVRGEKSYNVGAMAYSGCSKKLILEEVAKCDLVCAICHRIRTHERRK